MTTYTLWATNSISGGTVTTDNTAYTLGNQFSLSEDCTLTGIWWWSGTGAGDLPSACAIYAVSGETVVSGTEDDSPSWSGAAGSGWVKCSYDGTVTLLASTAYKTCVLLPGTSSHQYGETDAYWTSGAGASGITSGPITAPDNAGASPGQSSYNAGSSLAYPGSGLGTGANWWIDVEVAPAPSASPNSLLAFFP